LVLLFARALAPEPPVQVLARPALSARVPWSRVLALDRREPRVLAPQSPVPSSRSPWA